ncbi:hypothetical protein PVAND_016237 [Polypedilum vanderplanki]|uniref:Uncharacterized protein n=1 Tax=Polypedilum vanderplanki TaxID=319348 RepID=A0A9J6BF01_POLVA|nr:hypothetical protein PVAND_016237 [Polypedilum vanderplanki]
MKFSILFEIFIVTQIFVTSNSFPINCNFTTVKFNQLGTVYECSTTNILASSSIYVTSITGTHLNKKNNNDVASIRIQGNDTLPFVPRNFSYFFPNVKTMTIYNTQIETLYGDELDEFPQLIHLDFQYSILKTISSRLFEKTPYMVDIWLPNNKIAKVGYDLFTPLNMTILKWISFRNNVCTSSQVSNGAQEDVLSLIDAIRQQCPYDDEFVTTTTTFLTTSTITQNLYCADENLEDFVCDLKNSLTEVQGNLSTKNEIIDSILNILRENVTAINET